MTELIKKAVSLPPLAKKQRSYIQKTFQLLEEGCGEKDRLKIDGHIGDYRMRLFRLKDRKDYETKINSVFTSTFTKSIMPPNPQNEDLRRQLQNIIKSKKHEQDLKKEKEEQKIKSEEIIYKKGNLANAIEEEEHLYYSYIPEYQRSRWFEIKNASVNVQTDNNNGLSQIPIKKALSLGKKTRKNKYIFAYLQSPRNFQTIK